MDISSISRETYDDLKKYVDKIKMDIFENEFKREETLQELNDELN